MVQRHATIAISTFHSGRTSAGTVTRVDAARWPASASSRALITAGKIVGERGGVDDIGRDRHDVLGAEVRFLEHRRMFDHTTVACSPIAAGTLPSGAIGTTPEVWSQRVADSDSIVCA